MRTWDQNRTFLIPELLRNSKQWITWKKGKVPHNATVNNPESWLTFTEACEMYSRNDELCGIGYVFNGNGIVGIDLDGVVQDGKLTAEAEAMLAEIDSYTEISPSGTGVHCFVKGRLKGRGVKRDDLEMYDRGRYFTVTGDALQKYPYTIEERQRFIDRYAVKPVEPTETELDYYIKDSPTPPYDKMDALKEAIGKQFTDTLNLKRRDLTDTSMSGYDLALANFAHQANWSDQEIVDLLVWFRQKHNGKEKHVDYYRRTLLRLRACNNRDYAKKNPETGLDVISDTLGLDVEGIVQVGDKNVLWYLKLKGREQPYEVGGTADFIARKTWLSVVVDLTGKQLTVGKKEWSNFLQIMLDVSVKEELEDGDDMHVVDEYINEYQESRENTACVEDKDDEFVLAFLHRKPYTDKEGNLNFTISGLHRWIMVERGHRYGEKILATRLKAKGYSTRQVGKRIDGKSIKRRYWRKG